MKRKEKRSLDDEQLAQLEADGKLRDRMLRKLDDEVPEPMPNALARAHSDGLITFHTGQELLEAQRLYCIEFQPLDRVARTINRSIADLERWALLGGWHQKRRDRENRVYKDLFGSLSNISETIGVRTDELAANIEGCIERWLTSKQESGEELEPNEISKLTNSLSKLYDVRSNIHGLSGKTDVSKHEISVSGSPVLAESLARAMESLAQAKKAPNRLEVVDVDYKDSLSE